MYPKHVLISSIGSFIGPIEPLACHVKLEGPFLLAAAVVVVLLLPAAQALTLAQKAMEGGRPTTRPRYTPVQRAYCVSGACQRLQLMECKCNYLASWA